MEAVDWHDLRFSPSMSNKWISVTSVLDITVAMHVPRSEWKWGDSLFYWSLYLPAASVSKRCCWQTLDETNSLCSSDKYLVYLTWRHRRAPLLLSLRPSVSSWGWGCPKWTPNPSSSFIPLKDNDLSRNLNHSRVKLDPRQRLFILMKNWLDRPPPACVLWGWCLMAAILGVTHATVMTPQRRQPPACVVLTSQISGKRNSQGRTLVWSGDDTTQYLAEWSWLSEDSCCHLEDISKDE